jgi:hypothetical protein
MDYLCNFSHGGTYTNLILPAGITSAQAERIITDTIEEAINGPWILSIKQPGKSSFPQ